MIEGIVSRAEAAGYRRGVEAAVAVAEGRDAPDYIRGCTDGNCVIRRPSGQHTNGGCKCGQVFGGDPADMAAAKLMRLKIVWVTQQIRALLAKR